MNFVRKYKILSACSVIIIMIVLGGNLSQVFAQSLTLLTPNGGESWEANSEHTILWQSNSITKVKIEYSFSGGMGWHTVAPSVDASLGFYHWIIPDVQIAETLIRISDVSNPLSFDISDNKFKILKGTKTNKPNQLNKTTQTTTSNPIKIMLLGDSITEGEGDDTEQSGYRSRLFDLLENAGYNFDFVGTQSSGTSYTSNSNFDQHHEGHGGLEVGPPSDLSKPTMLDNVDSYLSSNLPDIVLLHMGTNDLDHIDPNNQIASQIMEVITGHILVANTNAVTFLAKIIHNNHVSETGLNSEIQSQYDALSSAQKQKIKIVDMHSAPELVYLGPTNPNDDFSEATMSETYNDLHPIESGYNKMANKWFAAMQNYYQPSLSGPSQWNY